MSANHPLVRRLRRLRPCIEAPLGLEDFGDLDEMISTLCRWAASMPWAAQLPSSEPHHFTRSFVVDCAVLARHEPWFVIDAAGDYLEDGPAVLVVLPTPVAHRGMTLGWAANLAELDDDRTIAAVVLATTSAELCALQSLLQVAYSAAFDNPCGRQPSAWDRSPSSPT